MSAQVHNNRKARFFNHLDGGVVECRLCPRRCRIKPGEWGKCLARINIDGELIAATYGHPAAMQVDPIEKKPFLWFMPGSKTFSIGTYGCNLSCQFCQNEELSRNAAENDGHVVPFISPPEVISLAREYGCSSVAFTYNEPTVFIEYAMDIAKLAKESGLRTVLVTNGYINAEPRAEFYKLMDAANIDLKAFSEFFYNSLCGGSLAPVLESCRYYKKTVEGHLEITNLLIPGRNDSPEMIEELLKWVKGELGLDTPIHFSAYYPTGSFQEPATPAETLYMAEGIARRIGFSRVHLGNLR
ncbi:MAG: AmmeMemoRadiSam system radical SAM enzyme [Lentisphaerae bacterium]|nr:AmmeMemoRadiSam system radical SAM enzyme [Lentisphaerota bacterium]